MNHWQAVSSTKAWHRRVLAGLLFALILLLAGIAPSYGALSAPGSAATVDSEVVG